MASNALLLLGCGSSGGNGVLTPPTVAPVLAVTADFGSSTANAAWTASNKTSSSGFGYRFECKKDSSAWFFISDTTSLTASFSDGTAAGNTYYFRVTPYNDAGEGPVSNEASVILPGESEAPVLTGWGEAADGADIGEFYVVAVNLDWTEIPGATNYDLYRAENPPPYGSGTYSLFDSETLLTYRDNTVVWDGGNGPYYGYKVIATNGGFSTPASDELIFAPAAVPPPAYSTYLRPGGAFGYRRPDGTSLYLRP